MNKKIDTILFIHGYGHNSKCWDNFNTRFKEKGFLNLYLFNYRNHGKNLEKNNEYYTNNDYSKDLNEYIYENNINNYIIIAHSNGCLITHYCLTNFNIKPEKVFLLGPLHDNNILDTLYNIFLDINLWPFFIKNKFEGDKLIRYALFRENTSNKIIENSKTYLEKVSHTKPNYTKLNKKVVKNINPYIILGKEDKLIPLKIALRTIELYNYNGIVKTFDIGHNMMLDDGWENVFEYILSNI